MTWKRLSSFLPIGGVAVATLLVSQCKIDKLLAPPGGGVLTLNPLFLADSAPLGSTAARTQRLIVANGATGRITWTAATAHSAAWLRLGAATGTAPDTLPLTLLPAGLALGTYRDTVVVTGSGSSTGELRVPVQFTVQACTITPIAVGTQTVGTLGGASCGAPHRSNHPAALYSFTGSSGDSISLELTAPAGYLVLDSATTLSRPSFSEAGACSGVAGNPCLYYQRLPRTGSYVIEVTTNTATDSGAFTLTLTPPRTPSAPTTLTQLQSDSVTVVVTGDTVSQNALVLRGIASDPDRPDSLRLEVEVKATSVAFTGTGTFLGAPAANGHPALVRVSGLADNSAYHWRARGVDQTGRSGNWISYGGNADTAADFVLGNSLVLPTALGQFKSDGVTALAVGATNATRTLILKGTVTDPAQSEPVRLEVEYQPVGTAFTNVANGSSTLATPGTTVQVTTAVLIDNASYHWQAREVSQSGRTSAWTPFGGNAESAADFKEAFAPQQLVFLAGPTTDTAGAPIHPTVQVAAQDSLGNTLASFTGNVTVAIDSNPGGATLSGTATVGAVAGVATFPGLSLDKTGVGYRLRASVASPSLLVKSGLFNVVSGAISATLSTVSASPAAIHASKGDSVSVITVTVKDPLGNPVPAISVVLADTAAGDSLTQPTGPTNASGVVTGTVSAKVVGVKHVKATAGGQALTQTATVTVIPAHAQNLVFSVEPSSASAGAVITPAIQVTARDSLGNTDTSYAGNVTVAIGTNPGGATLGGTKTVAAAHGVATFGNLTLDKTGTGYTLTATAVSVSVGATSTAFNITAGTGTKLAFTIEPTTAVAGTAIAPAIEVTAQDGSGNTVSSFTGSVTIALASNPGADTVGGTTTVAAVGGKATFSGLLLHKMGAGYTLSAAATGFSGATSSAFNVQPGTATQLAFTTQPTGASAGATLPASAVTAQDAFGNTDTTYVDTVRAAIDSNPGGGVLGGTTAVAAVHGVAAFGTLTIDKAGIGYRLAATATALTRARSNPFNITAGAVSASLSTVTALPGGITAGGTGSTVSVTARDSHGNPIAGATVVLGSTGAANTLTQPTTTTDSTGLTTGSITSTKAESKTVSATVDGVLLNQTATVTVAPGPISAAQATLSASPTSIAAGGGSSVITATAHDAFGNPIPGLTAVISASGAGNTVTQPPSATDASGNASGALSSTVAGVKVVSATVGGVAVTQTDTVTVTSGGATHLVFSVAPSNTTAGAGITPAIQVSALDANNNVAAAFTGSVTLGIGTNPGGGTLSGTASVAAVAGVATFPGMRIDRAANGYTLNATALGLVSAASGTFNIFTGAAAKLGVMSQPSAAAVNDVAFAQQPVIQIQDSVGNPVSQSGTTITAAIATGGGTLGGTLTASTGASGFATFTNLKITGVVGARTLTFTASGLTAVTSGTVTVSAGSATQIAVSGGNHQAATAGTAVGAPPSVLVTDVSGNPVSGVGVTFSLPGTAGANGSLTGAGPSTDGSGIATVGSWTLGTTAKPDSMIATSAISLSGSPITFVDTAKVGAPATVTKFSGDNLVGPVGTRLATPHDALVTDANGNPVSGVAVSWAAVGGGSVDSGTSHTDVSGHATMNRTLGTTPGSESTTATVGVLTPVSFTVTAQVGGATQMAVNAGDRQTDTVGVTLPVPLSVIVKDALNNPVSGVTISWSVLNGGGSVSAPTSVTNLSGIASINWTLGTAMSPVDSTQLVQATGVASPVTFTAFTVPGAVSSAQTSVTASSPISASSGSSQSTITVTARDQFGNVIKGKTVTLASTGTANTLTNPGATTNVNGVATGTLSSTKAESKVITATVGGVAITQQPTVVVDPAAATALNYVQQPTTVVAGAVITPAITVEILDAFGNRVTAASNAVSLALAANPGSSTLSGSVTNVAAVSGVATFANASLNKSGTGYTLAASATGLTGETSSAFNVTSGAVSAAQSTVTASSPIIAGGTGSTVTVTARDGNGNPIAGATVVLASSGTANTLTQPASVTDAGGVATGTLASTAAEAKTVSATVNGVGITQTATVTVNPAAASTITPSAGTGQSATVTTPVTTPPAVTVRDAFNNPVPGIAVTFGATASNGTVTGGATTTGANGVATVGSWTLGTVAKTDTLTATATVGTAIVTAVATPGPADHLTFSRQPSTTVSGASITPPAQVTAFDAQNNVATGFTGSVTLAIANNAGGGALSGTTSVSATSGVVSFPGISIDKAGTGYTLTASSTGPTAATSAAFDIAPGTATHLAFSQQPTNAVSGSGLTPAVTVSALDASGNVATGFSNQISLAIANNAGGGTLTGGAALTPVAGVATFSGLSIDKVGTGYTLSAAATGVTGATSSGFNITPGTATKLAFTVQPSSDAAGTGLTPAVQVTAQDPAGNTATGFNGTVTVAIGTNAGGGTLSGTTSIIAAAGMANFSDLSIDKVGTGYTLTTSSTGLTGATSTGFNITPAAASQLVFTVQPVSDTAAGSLGGIQVTARDAFGNTATAFANQVTLAIANNAGGGALSGITGVTPVAGVASFPALSINKAGMGYTLSASATGVTGSTSAAFNVTAGNATHLAFTTQPTDPVAGAAIAPAVTVTALDANNNVAAAAGSDTIRIGTNPGGSVLSGDTIAARVSGVSTHSTLSLNKVGTGYTLTARSSTLLGATSGTFNVTVGAVSAAQTSVAATSPITAGGAGSTVTVTARDANGNLISGATVVLAVSGTGNTITQPGVTNASGVTTGSFTSSGAEPKTVSATVNGVAITQTATVVVNPGAVSAAQSTVAATSPITASTGASQSTITVTARDALGNPISGATVVLASSGTGNTLTQPVGTTNASGVATGTLSSTVAESKTVSATIASVAITQTAAVVVNPGAAANLNFVVQPSSAASGASIAPPIQVEIRDALNNRVITAPNQVTLAIGTNAGGGALSGTVANVSPTNGVATFSNASIDKAGTGYTLAASATGLAGATSSTFNITAGSVSAAQSTVAALSPITASSGASQSTITITAKDVSGNPVAGATVVLAATGTNNTLTQPLATTNASGVATGTLSSTLAESKTVSATISGVGVTQTATVVVSPAAATQLVFTVQPVTDTAAGSLGAIQVTARDQFANTATAFTGTDTIAIATNAGGGTLAGTLTVAATAGVANFPALSINKTGTGYTLTVKSGAGVTAATSTAFNVTPGNATHIAFTTQPSSATAGATIAPAVGAAVQDANNNTVTGFVGSDTIRIGTNAGPGGVLSGDSIVAFSAGVASHSTLGINKTGTGYTLTARSGTLTPATSNVFNVTSGSVSASLTTVAATSPIVAGGTGSTITVTAKDGLGNPVVGATVVIGVTGTGNTFAQPAVTNASGVTTTTLTSTVAESKTVTATVNSVAITQNATVVVNPGAVAAAQSTVGATSPITASAGASTSTITVTAKDANGNVIPGATVVLASSGTGNTLTQPVGATNSSGVATGTLSSTVAESKTVSATINAVGITQTAAVVVNPGAAANLNFVVQPSSAVSGASIAPAMQVEIRDALNNRVTTATNQVTLAIANNAGGGTLAGTVTNVSPVSGVATFTNASIDKAGTGYTLSAAATTLTGATSSAFNITAGAVSAAQSTVSATSPITAGGAASTITVTAKDANGNPIAGATVVLVSSGTGNTLTQPVGTTNASGVATGSLSSTVAESKTVSATINSVGITQTATVVVNAGAVSASQSTVSATSPITAGGAASTITVTAKDANGNPLAGATVVLASSGTGNTLTQPVGTTNASGVATGSLSSTVAESKTVSATISSVAITQTATVVVNAGGATTIAAASTPPASATVSTTVTAPSVLVTDTHGNPVSGVSVTFAVTVGNGSISPPTPISTDGTGHATLTTWTLGTTAGTNTVTATSTGLTGSPMSFSVTGTAGAAAKIAVNAGQGQSATAGTAVATAPSVLVTDINNNPVSGVTVTFAVATGGGSFTGTNPTTTNASGIAAIGTWTLGNTAGANSLTATATGFVGGGNPVTFTATGTVGAATAIAAASTPPASATVGTTVTAPSVQVTDTHGNPVSGVSVTFAVTVGNGSISPTTPIATDGTGHATLTTWTLGTTAGTNTVTATATGLTGSPVSFSVTGTAGAAANIAAANTPPASATVGTSVTAPSVLVTDSHGNPVAGVSVTFAVTVGNGAVSPTTPITTDGVGHATATTWTLGTTAGTNTVTVTSTGLTGSPVGFSVTGTAGTVSAAQSTVSATSPITASSGASQSTITVTAKDGSGNPVSGATVVLAATGSGNTLTQPIGTTNGSGVATGTLSSTVAESKTVSATIASVAVTQTATVVVNPGAAANLNFVVQPTSAVSATAIAPAIQVEIRDALNNRVTTAANQVTLAIANNAGGGTLAGTVTNVSPASGVATFSNASIDKAGTGYTLSATATGLTPATSSAFNVTAGAAANITAASTPPASAPVGTSVTAPSVLVTDSHGNPVAGVGVTFTLTAGGGTITPASPAGLTTDAAGHATLTSWTLGTTAGTNTVTATSTGLSGSPVSFTVTGTAGTATHLAFTQQPTSATSGASIAPAITVTALDASNNVATGFANQISLAIGTNAGGGTLSGGAAVSPVNGVATFSAVSIDKAGTGYTLTTAATGVTGATSTTFNITAGTATHLVFTQPPTSAVSATSITPAITVTALDASNNVATGFANQISLAIGTNAGGGTLSGGAAVSPVSGVATFSAVSIDKAGTGYTLTTAATGVTGATSATFNITAGAATTIAAASTPPASATVGTSVTAPSVLLTDTHGNPVSGVSVTFAVTVGNGSIAPTTPVATDGTGHATLTTWTLGTTAGINTVTAAATGLTGSPVTFSVTGTAGAVSAAQSTVSAPSPITASSGASQSTITVTAKDANGNPISGATVVLAASGTGNTLTQPVGTTNGAGVATGTFSSTVAESKTVSATINGVAITQTATVVVNPGAVSASQSTVTASSPITASAGSSQSTITVTAKDANGNVIPGATVVLGATGSNNTVTGSGGTTNSSGVLTGTLSSTTAESKTVSATINGVAITQTATAVVNAGAATQLVFTVQPTGTTALATITPPVVVAAEDAFGNIDQNFSGPVTLTLLGGVGPLTGTNPQTAVLGVATFSDLAVSTPGTYQLQATATGPSSGTSSSFIITL